MPSPIKTASAPKAETVEPLIEVTAVRKFAVEYTAEEMKLLQSDAKEGRDQMGMTRMIEVGENAKISKKVAKILQDAGAVKVTL